MRIASFGFSFALLLSVGCDANPDERTLVSSPRLLAVQSSPPALVGMEGAVDLRALAIDGDGQLLPGEQVRYRVCSPWEFLTDPGRDCPESEALVLAGSELRAQLILDFYPPPPATGDPGGPSDEPDDACAAPSLIEVPIIAELRVDDTSLLTVKRIPVYLNKVARQNPRIEDIETTSLGDGEHALSIAIDPDSLDLECRDDVETLEAIRIYLYSTSGSFENASVDVVPTADGVIEPANVLWTSSQETATLFLVAVDNDGGVSWETISL